MACEEWIPLWMARMYGEATDEEAEAVERHLRDCAACRNDYETILATRQIVSVHAPQAPPAPRVMVLSPRGRMRPALAFAAGVAVTALVAVISFRLGAERSAPVAVRPPVDTNPVVASVPTQGDVADWARQAVDARLDEWSRSRKEVPTATRPVTREEIDSSLAALSRRVETDRRSDLDFLMARIAASDQRTEGWMDDTQRALQYVAYSSNPGISPR